MTETALPALVLLLILLAPPALAMETPAATPEEVRAKAEALLTEGMQKTMRDEPGGEESIEEAGRLYRSIGDRPGEALALVVRSMAAIGRSDYQPAIADLEAAIGILDAAGDRVSAALFLWMIAATERLDARFGPALAHLERSADLLAGVVADPRGASFRGFLSMARFFAGPSVALPELLPAGMEFATPLLALLFEGIVRDEMGAVLVDLERLDEAEEQLTRAEGVSQLLAGMLDMSLYAHLGDLRRRQWRLEEAKQYYERSLKGVGFFKILPIPMDSRLDIEARGRLAEIESLLGRLEEALSWNAQALELARKDGDRSWEAAVLEDRGDLLLQHDRIDQAESSYEAALRTTQAAKDRYREATALGGLSTIALLRGHYEVAAARLEASSAILRDLGKAGLEGPTNMQLAVIYFAFAADDSAASVLTQAHEAAKKDAHFLPAAAVEPFDKMIRSAPGEPPFDAAGNELLALYRRLGPEQWPGEFADLQALLDTVVALAKLTQEAGQPTDLELLAASQAAQSNFSPARLVGGFYLATAALYQGRLAEARSRATAALDMAKLLKNSEFECYAQMMLAVVLLKEGKSREGLDEFRGAVASLERTAGRIQSDSALAGFLGGARHQIYSTFISLLVQAGYFEEAFAQSEWARARAFLQKVGRRRIASVRAGDPALVAHAETLRRSISGWEDLKLFSQGVVRTRLEQDIAHAKAEYEGLMTRIEVTNPEYASLVNVTPLGVSAIQQNLQPDQTLISYYVIGGQVHAWVLSRSSLRYVPLELGEKGLEDVLCFSAELGRSVGSTRGTEVLSGCPQDAARATRLYRQLFAPLQPAIQGNKLLLVPHDRLHYLPFAALQDPRDGRFLLDLYTISYLPSASVLPWLHAKQSSFEGRALVLGAPVPRDPELAPLTGAAREAQQVAELWNTRPWLGAEARESRLYGLAGQVDLIHLAAHGVYDSRSSFFTHIALAPDEVADGDLEVHELLSEVDLTGVNLVVLSACETALGKRDAGDEIVSLARAILYAGSPAVVSTLWRIDDEASAELMATFYMRLRQEKSAAEALRQAQLALLHGERFREPFYWGAFTLVGELSLP